MSDLAEKYEMLLDYFQEHGSGSPVVLLERNIAMLMEQGKSREEAVAALHEKHGKDILKLYDKNNELLEQARIRAKKGKGKEQPELEPTASETEEEIPLTDSENITIPMQTSLTRLSAIVLFFYVMGAVIIIVTLISAYVLSGHWSLFPSPDNLVLVLVLLVSFSVGLTEIAVGWLMDGELMRRS